MSSGGGTLFLSFIVPVYNVEAYLAECLDSLLEQDIPREEYEIICVNDGSTDGSLQILRRYEQNFSNVRVIDQENGGVCVARNAGLGVAQGKYVSYVDSDDFVQKNSLGFVKKIIVDSDCDRLYMGAYEFDDQLTAEERNLSEDWKLQANSKQYNVTVWSNFYKLEVLHQNDISFHPEIKYGEDIVYTMEWNFVEEKELHEQPVFYYYRRRADSLLTAKSEEAKERKLNGTMVGLRISREYYQEKPDKRDLIADKMMSQLWLAIYMIAQLPTQPRKEMLKELKEQHLFPYTRPKECTLIKSYQTTRTDLVGQLFDKIYINLHTRIDFQCMRLWKIVERQKHRLEGRA